METLWRSYVVEFGSYTNRCGVGSEGRSLKAVGRERSLVEGLNEEVFWFNAIKEAIVKTWKLYIVHRICNRRK